MGVPEVAFLGRSNVGKSSLLNRLVGSEMARVGKTPGATTTVNLYAIYRKEKPVLGLVDLPGFGYAKLSKESKESVQQAAELYLGKRRELVLGILLVDSRRVPSDDDRAVLAALYDMGRPIVVVATKVDKLSSHELDVSLETIRMGLGLPEGQPLCVSSVTGTGIKELWQIIMEACEAGVDEYRQKVENGSVTKEIVEEFHDNDDDDDDAGDDSNYDDENIAYSQGYDWIHDSADIYNEDEGYFDVADDEYEYEYEPDDATEESEDEPPQQQQRMSIKFLRKMAKDMERRGEI